MTRIAVVGAGVIGVATCWSLCRQGHQVTLVDRLGGPGQGESFANGAQLSYAYCDALASPALLQQLRKILMGHDPAYRFRLSGDPDFLFWCARLLWNSRRTAFMANTRHLLELAQEARDAFTTLMNETGAIFEHKTNGKMILYPNEAACRAAIPTIRLKQSLGVQIDLISRDNAIRLEPALASYQDVIAGVAYSPGDAVGLADEFCSALVPRMKTQFGLQTLFSHEARTLLHHNGAVTGLAFARAEPLECPVVILATAHHTDLLPWRDRHLGAVWPVQGYSLSRPATHDALKVSVTDLQRKIVFAPVGNIVRIAGLADIGKRRPTFDANRLSTLRQAADSAFSGNAAGDQNQTLTVWTGARPCTPSSRPIIQKGSLRGLFLNRGHGTLGWTTCLSSADRLREILRQEGFS